MTTPVTEQRRAAIFALAAQVAAPAPGRPRAVWRAVARGGADPASHALAAAVPELLDALRRAEAAFLKAIGERDDARAARDQHRADFAALAEVTAHLEQLLVDAQRGQSASAASVAVEQLIADDRAGAQPGGAA